MEYKFLLKSLASNWTRRRWLDFRNGHSVYLIFLMTFANFVTIQYGLLIDQVPFLKNLFESIWLFAIIYVSVYVPVAIVIGYWHRKTQWRVEQHALLKLKKIYLMANTKHTSNRYRDSFNNRMARRFLKEKTINES